MPPEFKLNPQKLEDILNWILPGAQFLYRDTDFPCDTSALYSKVNLLRAGFFIDCSARASRLTRKTRFIILSAHSAPMWAAMPKDKELQSWKMHVLHFNSVFKVMDVFNFGGKTQVFLLHIPWQAIPLFTMETTFNFDIEGFAKLNLVEKVRKNFIEKMRLPADRDLESTAWLERTAALPGVIGSGFAPLEYVADTPEVAAFSQTVHHLADDLSPLNMPEE